jgi:polyhydroxyalkanoate synthesis regulator phasin
MVVIAFIGAFSCMAVGAQTPAPVVREATAGQQSDELKTQEQILDELKFRRAQAAALQNQVNALTEQIRTLEELKAALRDRGDFYKEAATARSGASVLEAERERIRREQIEEYRSEITRLRSENDSLRRSRDRRTFLGIALGAGLGASVRR